jgi:hypothetical protein
MSVAGHIIIMASASESGTKHMWLSGQEKPDIMNMDATSLFLTKENG